MTRVPGESSGGLGVYGKGIQRSESAKLSNEKGGRWRTRGIQRSESARLITMRQSPLTPRQNSHPRHTQTDEPFARYIYATVMDQISMKTPNPINVVFTGV
jgi:hypothetical protein